MHPFIAIVVGFNSLGHWLVTREGWSGHHELVWSGKPQITLGDRIYVTPASEGEDDLVVALYVAVLDQW